MLSLLEVVVVVRCGRGRIGGYQREEEEDKYFMFS